MDTGNNIVPHDEDIPYLPVAVTTEAHCNALRLPPDILLGIFFLFQKIYVVDSDDSGIMKRSSGPSWDWLVVTRVCKLWRNVALDWSILWTDIRCFTDLDKIRAFLERSQDVEIKVTLRLNFSSANATMALFERHMWRVCSFRIAVVARGWDSVKLRLVELTERAKVVTLYHEFVQGGPESDTGRLNEIPDNMSRVKLSSLLLSSVALPWSSTFYHGLSRLSISDVVDLINKPSISELKEILEHCPGLRHLTLKHFHPTFNNTEITTQTSNSKVNLPSLETIVLSDILFSKCTYLFSILNVRENVQLYISISDYPFDSLPPIPTIVFEGRKECESLSIELHGAELTIRSSNSSDGDATSSSTIISFALPATLTSPDLPESIAALVSEQYWQTAETVTTIFNSIYGLRIAANPHRHLLMNMLSALPKFTKKLEFKFSSEFQDGIDTFLVCISIELRELGAGEDTRLSELERLLIHKAVFTKENYYYFLFYTKKIVNRYRMPLKIQFLECKMDNTVLDGEVFVDTSVDQI